MGMLILRSLFAYIFLMLLLKLTGKRQLGEAQMSDFACTVLLSELIALPLADRNVPLLHGVLPCLLIALTEIGVSYLCLKCPKIRKIIEGVPAVLFANGAFRKRNLMRNRISEDEVRSALRINGIESLSEVKTVVLEPNGEISVIKKE